MIEELLRGKRVAAVVLAVRNERGASQGEVVASG